MSDREEELVRLYPHSIELNMSAKGDRYWQIKIRFDEVTAGDDVIGVLKSIDLKLKGEFKSGGP